MGMEIEKKYLTKHLPDNLDSYDFHIIEQAYLTTNPVIRVRREGDEYYMTYKGNGQNDTALAHTEYNLPLTVDSYNTLKSKADGNVISKKRILIPYLQYTIELDIFDAPFAPLIIAEVEFPSIEEAHQFIAPEWFDTEVTGKKEYANSYLSRMTFDTLK